MPTDPNNNEPIRISKIMAQRGIASRSEADRMIEKGWVMVDGRIVVPGDRAAPNAEIRLSNEAEAQLDNAVTVIMNKPRGFTSAADEFGGAPAMSLLTPENYRPNDASAAPNLMGGGLRVAGRLSTREMGLVIYTTDTALARRLAAADIEESWLIDFRAPPPDDAIAALKHALQGAVNITPAAENVNALLLTTATLGKGILSSICDSQEWRADITRTRRGDISLGDMPVRGWRLLSPSAQGGTSGATA
ncbi:MAG: hypothetical protein KA260_10715 [Burkholderiales bacterium]|nr:hypothetical protein [Burkholderiales bacterium]